MNISKNKAYRYPGPARGGVQGVRRTRAHGPRKSSGFRVNFWYRTINNTVIKLANSKNISQQKLLNEDLHPSDKKLFNGMGPDKARGAQ